MTEPTRYRGSCHCGHVTFEAALDASVGVTCNCSICLKRGTVLSRCSPQGFSLLTGAAAQTEYQFGKKRVHHFFCATCGVATFAQGTDRAGHPVYMVNLRCLDGFDPKKLELREFDGASLPLV